MYRKLLYSLLAVVILSPFAFGQLIDTVKFRVNMSIKMREGKFLPGSGDTVRVVGSFNNWSTSDATVRMASTGPTDSVYTLTRVLDTSQTAKVYDHNDTVFYKFFKTNRGGDWESVNNRVYALVNGSHQTPIWFFDNDSVANLPVSVTFRVNMAIKQRELTFQPGNGDIVTVPGSFNGWNTATDTVKKGVSDSIYSKTITMNEGDKIYYKFYKTLRGGLDWEGNQPTTSTNREYTVPVGGGNIPLVWFDNDSVFNATVQTNILFQTDMSAFATIGWFNAAKDTIQVRGSFEGWSGKKGAPDPIVSSRWAYTASSQILPIGSDVSYKFYIQMDSATAVQRFGTDWNTNKDGLAYEHPATRGDGNNLYTVANSTNQSPQMNWYAGINPAGLLKNTTDSVSVTLKVNMGPATRYSNPFNPSTDTLYLVWQDALWRAAQAKIQASFPATVKMTRQGATDSVFTVTFKVKGKAHYNMQYTYRYIKSDASTVDQGGGLGGQNPFITRFITATSPNVWPTTYTAPTDQWKKDPPLVGESAQYTTGVGEVPVAVPGTYSLYQNYPNPFNPATNIKYTLPQQANVRLRIYNLLGQEIAELVNTSQPAGTHIAAFDAHALASGVYFYKLEAGTFTDIKKMMLLK